jgi:uncharacterized membrane protein YeaQ/YmgE (transglycosylase-associated protein family)
MGWLTWIVFGLLAGAVARMITPGKHKIGCLPTLAVGLVGALIGGLVGQVVLGHKVRFGFDAGPFALAVIGAVVLLLALQAVSRR